MNNVIVDAFDFCRRAQEQHGEVAVSDLSRLAEEAVNRAGTLRWSLKGGTDELGHPRMHMTVNGSVKLVCQRCLKAFDHALDSTTTLVLAQDESSAEYLDELLDDDAVEVIVGSTACNLLELVEDEALLAMPLAPKHAVCPDQPVETDDVVPQKESPFAVLKNLKK